MQSRTILLVEDEPTLQRILGSVLSDTGHTVESVGTAEQALERLRDARGVELDCVLADKNLPGMNGLDLLTEVRKLERETKRLVAFLLVTGYPSRDSALCVLANDGDGYLVKPFRSLTHAVEHVVEVVQGSLSQRRAGAADARRVAEILAGSAVDAPAGLAVALDVDAPQLAARLRERLAAARVPVVAPDPARAGRVAMVSNRIAPLAAHTRVSPGSPLVLAEAAASFADLVALIDLGSGAVVDPGGAS